MEKNKGTIKGNKFKEVDTIPKTVNLALKKNMQFNAGVNADSGNYRVSVLNEKKKIQEINN